MLVGIQLSAVLCLVVVSVLKACSSEAGLVLHTQTSGRPEGSGVKFFFSMGALELPRLCPCCAAPQTEEEPSSNESIFDMSGSNPGPVG